MSKAMLIMDMPIDCTDCICSMRILDSGESGRCLKTNKIFEAWGKRQDWCPLREVPEKDNKCYFPDEYQEGYSNGWNACIRKILAEEGEDS